MKLLSAIATICLCVTISTAAEVGAPIQARQAPCSVTLFRGRHFAGPSFTMDSNQCVSTDHLSTTSRTDFSGLAPLYYRLAWKIHHSGTSPSPREPHLAVSAPSSLTPRASNATCASITTASPILSARCVIPKLKTSYLISNISSTPSIFQLPAVGSVQCKLADAAGCSNSNCRLRN